MQGPRASASHDYATHRGVSAVVVMAIDGDGAVHRVRIPISVANEPARAEDVTIDAASEGAGTVLTGRVVDAGALDRTDPIVVEVDWGDRSSTETAAYDPETGAFAIVHAYADDGTYQVTVTVRDGPAGNATETRTTRSVTIANAAPTVSFTTERSQGTEGATVRLIGHVIDPGSGDAHTVTVSWGDGANPEVITIPAGATGFSATHTYADDGRYTIAVVPADENGAGTERSVQFDVANARPVFAALRIFAENPLVQIARTTLGSDGTTVTVHGTCAEAIAAPEQITIDWGDGRYTVAEIDPDARTFAASYDYAVAGLDAAAAAAAREHIRALASIAPYRAQVVATDTNVRIEGRVTDAGGEDTLSIEIDWGDGTTETLAVDPATGRFAHHHRYGPGKLAQGTFAVVVRALDDDRGENERRVTIAVDAAPRIEPGQRFSIEENVSDPRSGVVVGRVEAADPEGAPLRYALTGGTDAGRFAIDELSGELRYIGPGEDYESGSAQYTLSVSATDPYGQTTTEDVFVAVTDVDDVRTLQIAGLPTEVVVPEVATWRSPPVTVEGNPFGGLAWTESGPDAHVFDFGDGRLRFLGGDFETPDDANGDGVYEVLLEVRDAAGNHASTLVRVRLGDVREERNLVLRPGARTERVEEHTDFEMQIGELVDGEPIGAVTFSVSGADAADFTLDPRTGTLRMAGRDFEAPDDANGDGIYEITVHMRDEDENEGSRNVRVEISDVVERRLLAVTGVPDVVTTPENEALVMTPQFTGGPIGDVTWTLDGADAEHFAIDSRTGQVRMAAMDYERPRDIGRNNLYQVTIGLTDADGNRARRALQVVVTNTHDEVRTLEIAGVGSGEFRVSENRAITTGRPLLSGDPVGTVTWTLSGADAEQFSIDASTGVVRMAARDYETPVDADGDNEYRITIVATDADGNEASADLTLTVTDVVEQRGLTRGERGNGRNGSVTESSSFAPRTRYDGGPIGAGAWSLPPAIAARAATASVAADTAFSSRADVSGDPAGGAGGRSADDTVQRVRHRANDASDDSDASEDAFIGQDTARGASGPLRIDTFGQWHYMPGRDGPDTREIRVRQSETDQLPNHAIDRIEHTLEFAGSGGSVQWDPQIPQGWATRNILGGEPVPFKGTPGWMMSARDAAAGQDGTGRKTGERSATAGAGNR